MASTAKARSSVSSRTRPLPTSSRIRTAQPLGEPPADQHPQRAAADHHRGRADDQRLVEIVEDGEAVGETVVYGQHPAVAER